MVEVAWKILRPRVKHVKKIVLQWKFLVRFTDQRTLPLSPLLRTWSLPMPTDPSTPENEQSIKLSVTVKSRLEGKYNPAALKKIKEAVERWKSAYDEQGIQTVHVTWMILRKFEAQGVAPVLGEVTPEKIKRAIDDLWKKLAPHYLVLFGGEDIVPMFPVRNPSRDKNDTDKILPSDSPYATHCALFALRPEISSFRSGQSVASPIWCLTLATGASGVASRLS